MCRKFLIVSHRKQCYSTSYVRFVIPLIYFECHTCGIFEGIRHPQEVDTIYPTTFAASIGFIEIIRKIF